jgi:hypothetical protein
MEPIDTLVGTVIHFLVQVIMIVIDFLITLLEFTRNFIQGLA